MDKEYRKQKNDSWLDPWDTDFYETGSTRPPKNNRGFYALILVVGIILGSILGSMDLKLPGSWGKDNDLPMSLYSDESTTPAPADPNLTPEHNGGSAVVQLNPAPQGVETVTQEGGLSLQAIYEKCIPSTVSILCNMSRGSSSGSGVVLSADGYVITNYHVVEDAVSIYVLLTDGRQFQARMVGGDKLSDLAVLKVDAQDLTPAEFGDSNALRVGDTVVAIGDPLGVELRGTMTDGIVSAINRNLTSENRSLTLIQTNAALNNGNSGGPLINCYGQVVGINTMKFGDYVNQAGVEGLGFALPSTTVKLIVDQLIAQGYVSGRPELGIQGVEIPEFYQYYHRLPAGIYVNGVDQGSDAQAQGIQVKDIILAVDGQRVSTVEDMEAALYDHRPGDSVEVIIYRSGKEYRVEIILGESVS